MRPSSVLESTRSIEGKMLKFDQLKLLGCSRKKRPLFRFLSPKWAFIRMMERDDFGLCTEERGGVVGKGEDSRVKRVWERTGRETNTTPNLAPSNHALKFPLKNYSLSLCTFFIFFLNYFYSFSIRRFLFFCI